MSNPPCFSRSGWRNFNLFNLWIGSFIPIGSMKFSLKNHVYGSCLLQSENVLSPLPLRLPKPHPIYCLCTRKWSPDRFYLFVSLFNVSVIPPSIVFHPHPIHHVKKSGLSLAQHPLEASNSQVMKTVCPLQETSTVPFFSCPSPLGSDSTSLTFFLAPQYSMHCPTWCFSLSSFSSTGTFPLKHPWLSLLAPQVFAQILPSSKNSLFHPVLPIAFLLFCSLVSYF